MKIYLWDYLLFRAGLKKKIIAQRESNQSLKNIVELLQIERNQHTASIRNLKAEVEALTDGLNALKPDVALAHEANLLDQITDLKEQLRLSLIREEQLRNANHTSRMNAPKLNSERVRSDVPLGNARVKLDPDLPFPGRRPVPGSSLHSDNSGPDLSTLAIIAAASIDTCEPSRSSSWSDSPSSSYSGDSGSSDGGGGGGGGE